MNKKLSFTAMVLLAGLIAVSGCQSRTTILSGQVYYQGKPLPGGTVMLFCEDKQIVSGIINKDGRYSIPNVPPGAAKVTLMTYPPLPAGYGIPQNLPPSKDAPKPAEPSDRSATYVTIPER